MGNFSEMLRIAVESHRPEEHRGLSMGSYALLVGVSKFDDPKLAKLTAPQEDVEALAAVLRDPTRGGFDQVETCIDKDVQTLREQLNALLSDRRPDDMVVFYYSGHGIMAKGQRLFLATGRSLFDRPQVSSLWASELRDLLELSRAGKQVVILDCCHSGGFAEGAKGVATPVTDDTFVSGEGQYVLTATDALQFAYDAAGTLREGADAPGLSRFTSWLVDGIGKGEAAPEKDLITLDELFEYLERRARLAEAGMTPKLFVRRKSGELIIARNPSARPPALSDDVLKRLDSQDWHTRKAAVEELRKFAKQPRLQKLVKNAVLNRISQERDVEVREVMEDVLTEFPGTRPIDPPPAAPVVESPQHIEVERAPKPLPKVVTPIPARVPPTTNPLPAAPAAEPAKQAEAKHAPHSLPKEAPPMPASDSWVPKNWDLPVLFPNPSSTPIGQVRDWLGQRPAYLLALGLPPLLFATWHFFRLPLAAGSEPTRIFMMTGVLVVLALCLKSRGGAILAAIAVGLAFAVKPAVVPFEGFRYLSQTAMDYWVPGVLFVIVAVALGATAARSRLLEDLRRLRPDVAALVIAVATSLAGYFYYSRPTLYDVYLPFRPQYAQLRDQLVSVAAKVDQVTGPIAPSKPLDVPLIIDERNDSRNEDPSITGHLFLYQHLKQPDAYFGDIEYAFGSDLHLHLRDTGNSPALYAEGFTKFASEFSTDNAGSLARAINAPYLVIIQPFRLEDGGRVDAKDFRRAGPYRVFLYDLKRDEIIFAVDVPTPVDTGDELKAQVNAILEMTVGAKILRRPSGLAVNP